MSYNKVELVIEALEQFHPGPSEAHSVGRLYEILAELEELPDCTRAVPALFGVLERFPSGEFGSPGPIVHALDAIAPCSKELALSLLRQPTFYTVTMVNAILNSKLSNANKAFWLSALENVQHNPRSSPENRALATRYMSKHAA